MPIKFTETDDSTVVTALRLHAHRTRRLHLSGAGADPTKLTITSTDRQVIHSTHITLYDGPGGIFTVDFLVGKPGQSTLEAKHGGDTAALPVTVVPPIAYPPLGSLKGAIVRVLLAESFSPLAFNEPDIKTGMQWMLVVLQNHSRNPAHFGGNAGDHTLLGAIKADKPVQVAGFDRYPHIDGVQLKVLNEILRIANNDDDARQSAYIRHIDTALDVATHPIIKDPCPTALTGWFQIGKGDPGRGYVLWKPMAGNNFYTSK